VKARLLTTQWRRKPLLDWLYFQFNLNHLLQAASVDKLVETKGLDWVDKYIHFNPILILEKRWESIDVANSMSRLNVKLS
jgi:hypothetical protein